MAMKIVVTSYDKKLRTLLSMGITGTRVLETYNVVEAASLFSPLDYNVLILDIDSGLKSNVYLKQIRAKFNLLIIMVGSDMAKAMNFVSDGFKDFILKPDDYTDRNYTDEFTESIVQHIKNVAKERIMPQAKGNSVVNFSNNWNGNITGKSGRFSAMAVNAISESGNKIIGIAASTGGTEALSKVLQKLPKNMPPIVIVQHFPPNFTRPYAKRLDLLCELNVKVADTPEQLLGGTVYIGDAGMHIVVEKQGDRMFVNSQEGKRVNGVIPAADVLFNSIAEFAHDNALGVILTGMGSDGAKGLLAMKAMGAKTIGQNEETCVVYGMPQAAKNIGAIDIELPLERIYEYIIKFAES